MTMSERKQLAAALVKARMQCPATVFKGGENRAQNYAYVGHEHVLTAGARKALLDNGLALLLVSYKLLGSESYKTSKGENACWMWHGEFLLLHTSGESLNLEYVATTVTNDKAGFVASTALDRTAHMRVLELAGSDQENPEHDSNEQDGSGNGQQGPTPAEAVQMLVDIDLPQAQTREHLVTWTRWLMGVQHKDKQAAWKAFEARCNTLKQNPSEIVAEARKAAA